MSLDQLALLQQQGASVLLKIGLSIILLLFGLFFIVLLKQIRSMNTIITQADLFPYLQGFVFFLLFWVVALFVLSLVIL